MFGGVRERKGWRGGDIAITAFLSGMFWFSDLLCLSRHVGWERMSFVTVPLLRCCCMEFGRSGLVIGIRLVMSRRMIIRYYE